MAEDKFKKLKIMLPTILLFAVYIFLYEITGNAEGRFGMGFVPVLIGIAVTIVYYFISSKLLKFNYGKAGDFLPQAVVFLAVNYMAVLYYEFTLKVEEWISGSLLIGINFLFMYFMGSSIYVFGRCIVKSIKGKRFGSLLKRAVSVISGYILYLLFVLAGQWVVMNWDFVYNMPWIITKIINYSLLYGLTAIFHFINGKLLKISSENFRDHSILLYSFACISCVLLFLGEPEDYGVLDSAYTFISLEFTYVKANLIYYLAKNLWNAFIKERKSED